MKLETENARLTAELAELRERTRWIPVNERLPKDSDCPIDSKGVPIPFVIGCINGALYGLIFAKHFQTDKYYTHWMPLPEPPEDSDAENQ